MNCANVEEKRHISTCVEEGGEENITTSERRKLKSLSADHGRRSKLAERIGIHRNTLRTALRPGVKHSPDTVKKIRDFLQSL